MSADSLSESVPDARTFAINCSSDLEVEAGGGRAVWRASAFLRAKDNSDSVGSSRLATGRRGEESTAYQRELAGIFFRAMMRS